MKKDETAPFLEQENEWNSQDPNKRYLIQKEKCIPFDATQARKPNYLKQWRETQCDQVSAEDFHKRVSNIGKHGDFRGLVLPEGQMENGHYDYAIFTSKVAFISPYSEQFSLSNGYSFNGARFQSSFEFAGNCSFYVPFPFLGAKVCKSGKFFISGNVGDTFKESRNNLSLKEPLLGLEFEEGGLLSFRSCCFPEGFTLRNLNLKNTFFRGSNIEKVRFINCKFEEEKGSFWIPERLALADENQAKTKSLIENQKIPDDDELSVMYQLMKKSFEEQKDYQTAGKFYVSEMHFRQKDAKWFKQWALWLYGFCAGYGESVGRTALLLFLCVLFSILLHWCSTDSWGDATSLAFSSLFLFKSPETVGFADVISRLLFIVSGFLFINAIRRRLRRS